MNIYTVKYFPVFKASFTKFILSSASLKYGDERIMKNNVLSLYRALVIQDYSTVENLMENNFTYRYADKEILLKSDFLNKIIGKSFKSIKISNQTIHFMNDVTIVKHQIVIQTTLNIIDLGVRMVWLRENKSWLLWRVQTFDL